MFIERKHTGVPTLTLFHICIQIRGFKYFKYLNL